MFKNVDRVHGCFLQYAILKVVVGRFRQGSLNPGRNIFVRTALLEDVPCSHVSYMETSGHCRIMYIQMRTANSFDQPK